MFDETLLYLVLADERNWNLDKNVGSALQGLFAKVVRYPYREQVFQVGFRDVQKSLLNLVKTEKPDYMLWPMSFYEIHEETLSAIREEGTRIVAWFFDDPVRFDDLSRWCIPYIDFAMTNDLGSVAKYTDLGIPCFPCVFACNPDVYVRLNLQPEYDVSFVGKRISNRVQILDYLANHRVNLRVFGEGLGKHLAFEDVIRLFNVSKINLNLSSSYASPEIKQIKGRVFEVTTCRGFLLSEYAPGLETLFEIDKEIVCFETPGECVEKIRYYLDHDDEREAIAQAGYIRAHRDHTWRTRLTRVFDDLHRSACLLGKSQIRTVTSSIPVKAKLSASNYHYGIGVKFFRENRYALCKDEIELALGYNPSDSSARRLLYVLMLPPFMRPWVASTMFVLQNAVARLRSFLRIRSRLRFFLE